ncbi:MAG TPA: hypothetical protein H9852_09295 [Candidatus Mediterraneibacter colneyensis]|nr:hypothetical protein [Candidatus Mediterraneibacter colneyensis]
MKKLAFYHLMLRFRRRLPLFLIYFAGYVIISVFILNFAVAQFLIDVYRKEGGLPRTYDERQALITDLVVSNNFVFVCIVMLLLLGLLWLISRKLPLSLPKALYACPLNEQEKLHCLRYYLIWKCICLLAVFFAISFGWFYVSFFTVTPFFAVQLSLTIFTLIAFSLNPDPGNRREALKKCPDIVTEKSSGTFVNIYWSALLLLENTVFYSVLIYNPDFTWADAAWWIPAFLLNLYIAKRHVTPVLKIMLDYEKLYFPIEDAESMISAGQADTALPPAES